MLEAYGYVSAGMFSISMVVILVQLIFLRELNVGVLLCVSVRLCQESVHGVATELRRKWCKEGKKPFLDPLVIFY